MEQRPIDLTPYGIYPTKKKPSYGGGASSKTYSYSY